MDAVLLDTDMLSEVLKHKHVQVLQNAAVYFQQHGQFAFSAMTRYEVLRGLLEKRAVRQLVQYDAFCQNSLILPATGEVFQRAAELWSLARQTGKPHRDADLIIAATALVHGRDLATGNSI